MSLIPMGSGTASASNDSTGVMAHTAGAGTVMSSLPTPLPTVNYTQWMNWQNIPAAVVQAVEQNLMYVNTSDAQNVTDALNRTVMQATNGKDQVAHTNNGSSSGASVIGATVLFVAGTIVL